MLPPLHRSNVLGMQADRSGARRDAAIAVNEVLSITATQIVADADVRDEASYFAPIHRVDRWRSRQLPNGRHLKHGPGTYRPSIPEAPLRAARLARGRF